MVTNDVKISQKIKKERPVEYRKNYSKMLKSTTTSQIKTA